MAKRDGQGIKREKSEAMKQTEEWNTAKSRIENQIKELRHRLHTCPEISGQERKTKAALKQFLEESTNLELHDCGGGFYAVYRSSTADSAKKGVAFRADYDALALPEGGAAHLCGHDGHASALCGAALLLEVRPMYEESLAAEQRAKEAVSKSDWKAAVAEYEKAVQISRPVA